MRKKLDDSFSRLDTIHERDGQTDGETEGLQATAKTALTHSVARYKLESQNEITIVGEYKYERRVCEHRHIFLVEKYDNSQVMLKWNSFECIGRPLLVGYNCHDEWRPTLTLRCEILHKRAKQVVDNLC